MPRKRVRLKLLGQWIESVLSAEIVPPEPACNKSLNLVVRSSVASGASSRASAVAALEGARADLSHDQHPPHTRAQTAQGSPAPNFFPATFLHHGTALNLQIRMSVLTLYPVPTPSLCSEGRGCSAPVTHEAKDMKVSSTHISPDPLSPLGKPWHR